MFLFIDLFHSILRPLIESAIHRHVHTAHLLAQLLFTISTNK